MSEFAVTGLVNDSFSQAACSSISSCFSCNLPTLQRRRVAITRLKHPANFGRTSHEVRLFVLVICPSKEVSIFIF
jgi:hypothetical protein